MFWVGLSNVMQLTRSLPGSGGIFDQDVFAWLVLQGVLKAKAEREALDEKRRKRKAEDAGRNKGHSPRH